MLFFATVSQILSLFVTKFEVEKTNAFVSCFVSNFLLLFAATIEANASVFFFPKLSCLPFICHESEAEEFESLS